MVHVDSLAMFPVVVVNRTHIGGRPADVTADLLRRPTALFRSDNGTKSYATHGTTVGGGCSSVATQRRARFTAKQTPPCVGAHWALSAWTRGIVISPAWTCRTPTGTSGSSTKGGRTQSVAGWHHEIAPLKPASSVP